MKLDPYHTLLITINLKLIKDLNIRPKTIKLLEEYIGKSLNVFVLITVFLNMSQKHKQ